MKIAVIGAGAMGSGIAQTFAVKPEYEVMLCDVKLEWAEAGKGKIEKGLNRLVKKEKMTEADVAAVMQRISIGTSKDVADCDLVVEAAVEKMELKKNIFKELDELCKPETVFATNTSSLSVTELTNGLSRPVVGMHFFNPAPVMKLVEVVKGLTTPTEVVDKIVAISESIGKIPVVVEDSAGFVVNRILVPMINEAIGIYAEGVADAADIDTAMKLGANHPMGPLALGDLVGLDVCLAIMEVLTSETGDPKYRPHPLLRKMVRANQLGRKTGKGFFEY
ncbi:3-hydroxyacyl-CoA dehydrogenase NAD-binding domain-containing protein [Enterococcus sp. HY326]|uniref:3-hydroxyacyl-CoA dehydrogenase NAD-binding domain-containing protein n=1 Tax=Enterococcus sp. HY326 TaxID=2971265 RepID=UPI002240A8E8|nr:3-hydroxyacyl-CoA dehydrogenase NAD-binding domain-containing protein [Enterococcus sp. HY326]